MFVPIEIKWKKLIYYSRTVYNYRPTYYALWALASVNVLHAKDPNKPDFCNFYQTAQNLDKMQLVNNLINK